MKGISTLYKPDTVAVTDPQLNNLGDIQDDAFLLFSRRSCAFSHLRVFHAR